MHIVLTAGSESFTHVFQYSERKGLFDIVDARDALPEVCVFLQSTSSMSPSPTAAVWVIGVCYRHAPVSLSPIGLSITDFFNNSLII
jgi:hypothetical protein